MIARELVYEMLTKEDNYAKGWASPTPRPDGTVKTDHMCSAKTGLPFGHMDWIVFAEKYLNEAKLAYANYTPDDRTIRIRLIKAASLLVSALQCHCEESDLETIAGVSSRGFPVLHGGLATFKEMQK